MVHAKLQYGIDKTPNNRAKILTDVAKQPQQVIALDTQQQANISTNLFSYAFAQDAKRATPAAPPWLSKIPGDKNSLYFIGISDSHDLKEAQESSRLHARKNAVEYLLGKFEQKRQKEGIVIDSHELAKYIVESAEYTDTFFTYDGNKKLYHYYTLLRLDKKVAELRLDLFALQSKIFATKELLPVIIEARLSQNEYLQVIAVHRERLGFLALLEGNITEARVLFGEAYAVFPTYHNVDEIYRKLLTKDLVDKYDTAKENQKRAIQADIFKQLLEKYAWGMPPDIKSKVEEKVKALN